VRWSPNTLRSYATDLKHWFDFLDLHELQWNHVKVQIVPDWIEWLRFGEHRSRTRPLIALQPPEQRTIATINRKLSALHTFYRYHGETEFARTLAKLLNGRTKTAPHLHGQPFHLKAPNERAKSLSETELQAVLAACDTHQESLLVGLMGQRGLRIGQVLGLRHQDLSVQKLEYSIVPGRDNANQARTKTKRTHILPLTKELAQTYKHYLIEEYGTVDSDYVFVNFAGPRCHEPMAYDDTRPLLQRLQQRTGLAFTWHVLRHTFATLACVRGVPISVVQEMLCHLDPKTTSETYLHLTADDLRRLLDGVLNNGVQA